jgi:hypothetical protein
MAKPSKILERVMKGEEKLAFRDLERLLPALGFKQRPYKRKSSHLRASESDETVERAAPREGRETASSAPAPRDD